MTEDEEHPSAPSRKALPFLYFTGQKPLPEPYEHTESIARVIGKDDIPEWDLALRRISRRLDVDLLEAEAMLVTALRDPRHLLIGVYIRHSGGYRVRRSPWADSS